MVRVVFIHYSVVLARDVCNNGVFARRELTV